MHWYRNYRHRGNENTSARNYSTALHNEAVIFNANHYNDVIMTTIASQITSLMVVYSTVYSDPDQRKHQSSASLAFVWGIHRDRWIPRTKGQLRGKCFHLMTSSWFVLLMADSVLKDMAKRNFYVLFVVCLKMCWISSRVTGDLRRHCNCHFRQSRCITSGYP